VLARIRQLTAVDTRGGSRMRESRTYGSVRGARGNSRPYREGTDLLRCTSSLMALSAGYRTAGACRIKVVSDALANIADKVLGMTERVDAAVAAKRRRDKAAKETAEAARIEAMLDALPDPDKPDDTPAVGGHLHAIDPVEKQSTDALTGNMPNELEEGAPHFSGPYSEPNPKDLAHPKVPKYRAPVAIGGP
jgi:hypothetical protein